MSIQTEKIILDVARRQFVARGYAGTRMQEIADEAGINKALLYYYFRSKEKIYQQIVSNILNLLVSEIGPAIKTSASFKQHVKSLVGSYFRVFNQQPDIPIFIMSELSQRRQKFVEQIQKRAADFPNLKILIGQTLKEMNEGTMRKIDPVQLLLNVISMTVFPFMSRPVFQTILNFSDQDFTDLMKEREAQIIDFIDHAIQVK